MNAISSLIILVAGALILITIGAGILILLTPFVARVIFWWFDTVEEWLDQ